MKVASVAEARKFLTAAGAAVAVIVAAGLLTGTVQTWVTSILSALSAFLVYFVPNAQPTTEGSAALDADGRA